MTNGNGKSITVNDLWVASAVSVLINNKPEMVQSGEIVVFQFPRTNEVLDAIDAFNSDVEIPARTYAATVKELKGDMFRELGGYQRMAKRTPKVVR